MIKIHLIIARTYLLQNNINAGHMLPPQRLEIMPRPQAKPGMGSIILNHMADIFHTMLPAPFSDLTAEIPAVQIGHHVHILISGLWGEILHLVPQRGKPYRKSASPEVFHHPEKLLSPWQLHIRLAYCRIMPIFPQAIPQLRFIREKSCKSIAEVLSIMFQMGFINHVQKKTDGGCINGIDIFFSSAAVKCAFYDDNIPVALRDVPI